MVEIRKAERRKAKLRLGISAPTGAGKTYSSLLIASGISQKVGLVDTENGSGDLYADDKNVKAALPNGYDIINISAPFDPSKYIEAIEKFESAGYGVIIIDSLSHAWAGAGGLLDKQGKEADKTGNSYTAWRKVTPQHNALVDKLIQSPSHIIACIRAKTEYVQEKNEQGKTVVRKVGMAPIFRDGFEYEMTIFGEMDQSHNFQASKDRTGIFGDQFFVPSKKTGEQLLGWLNSGKAAPVVAAPLEPEQSLSEQAKFFAEKLKGARTMKKLTDTQNEYMELIGKLSSGDEHEKKLYARLEEIIKERTAELAPKKKAKEQDAISEILDGDSIPDFLQPKKEQANAS